MSRSTDCIALRLREIGRERSQTLLTPFDRPEILDGDPKPRVVGPRRWLHALDCALLQLHPFGSLRAAAAAPIRLLPYQLEPALAMRRDGVARVLIADGVGLGKTIQAGLLLQELAHHDESCRALVLAPAGLRDQWCSELSTHFSLQPIFADSAWLRSTTTERPAHVNPWSLPGIYIASHDLVKRPEVLRPLEDLTWDAVVIDEAHAVSAGTDRRAAAHAIAARSRHVLLLTATPHGGDPAELEALCRIGGDDPILLFQRSRAEVAGDRPRKTTTLSVVPAAAERRMHELLDRYSRRVWDEAGRRGDDRARLVSILLRKRALSSAGSLAVSVERRLALLGECQSEDPWQLSLPLTPISDEDPLEDDEPRATLAVRGLADPKRERRWLMAIAKAARIAAGDERKIRFLARLLARIREPAIVFTEYRDTLARIQQHLAEAGHDTVILHGGLPAADRNRVQCAFNAHGGTLLATDAASEGLNLHHRCRVVVHFELPWNPSRLEQRAGRVDRLGQTRRVHEIALVAMHTAERLVLAPLFARSAWTGSNRGRMLDALTESRVAAAVMSGTASTALSIEASPPLPVCAVLPSEELRRSAVAEAGRLGHHRHLATRSRRDPGSGSAGRAVISTLGRRSHVPRGLLLVFSVALVNGDGAELHAEPCLLGLDLEPRFQTSMTAEHLREIVAAVARSQDGEVSAFLERHSRDRLDAVSALEANRRAHQRRRERAIAGAIAPEQRSTARLLVQAGLFDRRALRAAALRAGSVAARQEEMNDRRLPERSQTTRRMELLAALHVAERR